MRYEIELTSYFRSRYNKLDHRFKRCIDNAVEILKDYPTDYQQRITFISKRKEGGLYRFRMPGCYLYYIIPEQAAEKTGLSITLTEVKVL
jgi:mRNA-degrading endonuclease RelE of RelBE toxin-antitoxin system